MSEKEIRRLRRQVRQLRNERDMNATAWCARETGPWEVYRFMSAHQGRFRVTVMARVLGVSTSGYYAWRGRPPSARARADAELTARVQEIHAGSRGTYGAPRIHAELVACGVAVGRKRVARVMRAAGITGVAGRWPAGSRTSRSGWAPRKGKGSHRVFTHPTKPGIVVVPHPRKDLMVGTLRNIYRQAGWRWGGR